MVTKDHRAEAFCKRAIHIVDDESQVLDQISLALHRLGYTVHAFTNGLDAIDDIEVRCRNNVSLLISDIRMQDHTGFEIARRARAVNPDVPIILITPFEINPAEFDTIFPSLHINEFIQKPLGIQQLVDLVKKYAVYVA